MTLCISFKSVGKPTGEHWEEPRCFNIFNSCSPGSLTLMVVGSNPAGNNRWEILVPYSSITYAIEFLTFDVRIRNTSQELRFINPPLSLCLRIKYLMQIKDFAAENCNKKHDLENVLN